MYYIYKIALICVFLPISIFHCSTKNQCTKFKFLKISPHHPVPHIRRSSICMLSKLRARVFVGTRSILRCRLLGISTTFFHQSLLIGSRVNSSLLKFREINCAKKYFFDKNHPLVSTVIFEVILNFKCSEQRFFWIYLIFDKE